MSGVALRRRTRPRIRQERFLAEIRDDIEHGRYRTLLGSLRSLRDLIAGRRVVDFGASYGLSAVALIEMGARHVIGVEPDRQRVERGNALLAAAGYDEVELQHVIDTRSLDVPSSYADLVVCNAVLEHIPQPRSGHIREMWRVLRPGGTLYINETPNKYLPWDFHTTGGLWFVPWLPSRIARRYAIWRRRFRPAEDWAHSGWRGLGYYELVRAIPGEFTMLHECTRRRHRVLRSLGLPSSLFDPYPVYRIRKSEAAAIEAGSAARSRDL